jgi:hypothetical protein
LHLYKDMKSDSGNREWLNEYMSLKQVNQNNPFTVPEGYFDELEQQIMASVKLEEIKKTDPAQGFTVPENYFDELANNITARIKIEEALDKEANGLTVPENYFEELANNIQARIHVEEALNTEPAAFTVPEDYFDNLHQQIQSRIFVEEALAHNAGDFTIPNEYFNQLTEDILNKTARYQEPVKRKTGVVRQLFSYSAIKYATAACVTLAIGGTILLTRSNGVINAADQHNQSFLHKSLAAIPIGDIQNYLKMNVDATDTRTLLDESKQVNADNLNNDLQDELDTTSQ